MNKQARQSSLHKSIVGDLTWEVPELLEDDFGLSRADKDQLFQLELQRREMEMTAGAALRSAQAGTDGPAAQQPPPPPQQVAGSGAAAAAAVGQLDAQHPVNLAELNRYGVWVILGT